MFRLRPATELFPLAQERNVGIIVRVPLASGLLSGKYTLNSVFGKNDHRAYNRNGEFFDKGETFSGVDYAKGIHATKRLMSELPTQNLAQSALRYILMHPAVSTVIPGASSPEQIIANIGASALPPFTPEAMNKVQQIYDEEIRQLVHHLW